MLLFIHVIVDAQHLYISAFSLCVTFLSETVVLLPLSNFHLVIPLVISGKVIPVSFFQHMVIKMLPCYHRFYILFLILLEMLLVDDICLT